jgi:hypothetical protein
MESHAGGKGQAGALAGCHSSNCSAFSGRVETPDHVWKRRIFNNLRCEMAEDERYYSHSARERIFGSLRANSIAIMLAARLKTLQETLP